MYIFPHIPQRHFSRCILILTWMFLPFIAQAQISEQTIDTAQKETEGGLLPDCESNINLFLTPGTVESRGQVDLKEWKRFDLSEKYLRSDWNLTAQGDQFSCTAFTVAFAISIQRNIDNSLLQRDKELIQFSPSFVFNVAKAKYAEPFKSNCKKGISFIDAFLVVRDRGIPTLSIARYTPKFTGCTEIFARAVFKEAGKTKINIFQPSLCTVDDFKSLLLDTPFYPICIGLFLNSRYDDAMELYSGRWDIPGTPNKKRMHAMLIVGFDEDKQAFKVMDWQGRGHGDNGFLWLGYKVIEAENIVFNAFICSHQSELISPDVGARAGTIMNETSHIPEALEDFKPNSQFVNDEISFWIKSGYYTTKDQFRIDCNYVSDVKGRATFRISNIKTGEIIKDDLYISEGSSRCFAYKSVDYKLTLVEIDSRGKNIFKKAAVLRFFRNQNCNTQK